jgi:hypothetical protein
VQWEIQVRSRFCSKCEKEFLDGDTYRCVLTYRDDQPFRQDFCEGCWDGSQEFEVEQGEELISWWRSTVRIPPPKPKEEAIKRSFAEELLRKYLHSTEPKHIHFCYILAVMLERRRVLSQKHTIEEDPSGRTLLVYEHTKTGETFIILDPHLELSTISKVQAEVKEILDAEQKAQEAEAVEEDAEDADQTDDSIEKEAQK